MKYILYGFIFLFCILEFQIFMMASLHRANQEVWNAQIHFNDSMVKMLNEK